MMEVPVAILWQKTSHEKICKGNRLLPFIFSYPLLLFTSFSLSSVARVACRPLNGLYNAY